MKFRLSRPNVPPSEPSKEDIQDFYEGQAYEQYYDEHYSQYEDDSVYSEQRKRNGIVSRGIRLYKGKSEELKNHWSDNVSLQKSYYEDKDSRWLANQQKIRTDDFIKKLIIAIICLGILTAFMYIITVW